MKILKIKSVMQLEIAYILNLKIQILTILTDNGILNRKKGYVESKHGKKYIHGSNGMVEIKFTNVFIVANIYY
jgi:hypothetical protein